VGTLSKWITAIGAAFKRPSEDALRPTSPPLHVPDESGVEGAVAEDAVAADKAAATVEAEDKAVGTVEVEDDVAATVEAEDEVAAIVEVEDEAVPAEVELRRETQVTATSKTSPDQQEIQRRRELVRALFNDFWKGNDEKPVTFVDRLNQAEAYLNERLIDRGEPWQLDASTRKMLGLPPRAN
jgi:dGTP triphosphohydrolase